MTGRERTEPMGDHDWISGVEAAAILGVSKSTVYRTLSDETERARTWGDEGVGWRKKPLSRRGIFQVSRQRAQALAETTPPDRVGEDAGS